MKINISNIPLDIKIQRLEKDIFSIDLDQLPDSIPIIEKKYGTFFDLFTNHIIKVGDPSEPYFHDKFKLFITNYVVYKSYQQAVEVFPNLNKLETEITMAFKHYKYYFPSKPVPSVYTYVSGFNQSIVVAENILAIGLDKYLGRNCDLYSKLMVSEYLKRNMDKSMIVSDCMKAWATTEYIYNDSIDNLINQMIYNGKIHYFQKAMIPGSPDSIIMGFSEKQIKWCESNEKKMWEYLIENKLLFENNYLIINNFTKEGPFTKEFGGKNSPARAANWLGWQIVKAFMNKNRSINLPELMKENDYQKILVRARYRP